MASDKLKTEREGRIPLPNSPKLDSSLHQPKWEPMHKANFMHNPDGSKTEVGPALDPKTQEKVTAANQQYRTTGKEFKNPPFGVIGHRVYPSWAKPKHGWSGETRVPSPKHAAPPGTIKKAMDFVARGDKDNPNWHAAEKKIRDLLSRVSTSVGDNQGLQPHMSKAQFPEKDVKMVKPDLKPSLKPEAKEALQNWYRNVYRKAFRYTCGNCGHSDAVHTIGGHPQPTSWGCARCHADTKDIKPITEAPVARGKFKTEPVFSDEEKKKVKETGGFFKGFGPPRDVQRQEAMDRRMERINKKPVGGITFSGGPTDPRAGVNTKRLSKAEPQFKWPDAKKPPEKSKAEQWREWAAERVKDANAGKFKKGEGSYLDALKALCKEDKCPKCGGRMSQGAPHVAGNVKQNECHGCGHIEVTSRDA